MLLTGQPLHAFDLDKVPGGELIVRTAERGREDDDARRRRAQLRRRDACSSATATGPPGSPGSWAARSPRSPETTTRVLLEVATWNGANILRTSRKLGLRSEASTRFEKQLHPELAMRAQRDRLAADGRALRREAGARARSTSAAEIPEPHRLELRARAGRGPARDGDRARAAARSTWSGSASGSSGDGETWRSTVPSDRHYDVTREVDLIEEVGRVHGLDRAPAGDAAGAQRPGRRPDPRAEAAPPGRGRAARPRLRRDRQLELHRPRRCRRGCGSRTAISAREPIRRLATRSPRTSR